MQRLAWGLIGCGDIARKRVAPALRDLTECDLVAVSRGRSELAKSFSREFGAKKWYSNWQELLLDDEIDAAYIATPVDLHAAHHRCVTVRISHPDSGGQLRCRTDEPGIGVVRLRSRLACGREWKPAERAAGGALRQDPFENRHFGERNTRIKHLDTSVLVRVQTRAVGPVDVVDVVGLVVEALIGDGLHA